MCAISNNYFNPTVLIFTAAHRGPVITKQLTIKLKLHIIILYAGYWGMTTETVLVICLSLTV